jgi:multiple sugar transport system ATP-binding protein
MTEVRYDEATRTYEGTDVAAVDSLSLDIADGELLVLVGPSGSGKSTALRMLAGLEPLNAGTIYIGDRDVSNVRPRDRDIAMVFQNYALYPQLSVAENMGFALKQQGVPKEERRSRAASASASRWDAPSSASPRCTSWTSRSPTSTPSCACRRARRSSSCRPAWA